MDPIDIARLVLYLITHPEITGQAIAARWIRGRVRYNFVNVSVPWRKLEIDVERAICSIRNVRPSPGPAEDYPSSVCHTCDDRAVDADCQSRTIRRLPATLAKL